ncbi:MAG: APC family permease [Alphaproteobacteria bacterium]|nr:APC family permease [Alphaproteobacteria bacterium]
MDKLSARDCGPPKLKFLDVALTTTVLTVGLRWLTVAAAVGPASFPVWFAAYALFFLPLVAATAEMTDRVAGEGGIYAWVRDTLGPLPGFVCGWFYWIGLIPVYAGMLYFLAGLITAYAGYGAKDGAVYLAISIGLLGIVIGVQLLGLRAGKWLTNFGSLGSWAVFAVILGVALLIARRGGAATHFLHASYVPGLDFDTAILVSTIVFAFGGPESLGFVRNEIEGGIRTVRRALVVVGFSAALIYCVGTAAFLVILPQTELTRLAGFQDALQAGLARTGLGWLAPAAIGAFALAMFGSLSGWFGAGARLPFAAGLDHFLPPLFARRNAGTGAPVAAILLQAALTLVVVVLSQAGETVATAYDLLVAMGTLTTTIPYVLLFVAYRKISRDGAGGAWRPPGGARTSFILASVGVVSSLTGIACALVPSAADAHPLATFLKIVLSTLAMLIMGLALYWLATSRRPAVDAPLA